MIYKKLFGWTIDSTTSRLKYTIKKAYQYLQSMLVQCFSSSILLIFSYYSFYSYCRWDVCRGAFSWLFSSRGGAKRRKEEGGIFENGRKCEKTLYFHPNSKKNLYISSPKIGDNLKDIFSQNRRKLCPNFPKQEGGTLPQLPPSVAPPLVLSQKWNT